jgi:hypothetical protein
MPTNKTIKIIKIFLSGFLLAVLGFSFFLGNTKIVLAAGNTIGYAWSQSSGWLDFNPAGGGVEVFGDKLTGYAWGDGFGWVNFDCASTPGECPDDAQKVINDGSGNLSGFAWSASIGWLDFNPTASQVVIDSATGDFSGYAWIEAGGWLSFDCLVDGACVNTSWRVLSPPTNLRHTNNPEVPAFSITWAWDEAVNPSGTCYDIWLKDVAGGASYYLLGSSCSLTFTMDKDYNGALLTSNTEYFIEIAATHALYTNSVFTNPNDPGASAYTSASTPVLNTPAGVPFSETQIDWSWLSGGAETGFYAQIYETDDLNKTPVQNSDWTTNLSWSSINLACNTSYTLQVKAKNADYDTCAVNNSCQLDDFVCMQTNCPGDQAPNDATAWAESAPVSTLACNNPPIAAIVVKQIIITSPANTIKFNGEDSSDDNTLVADLKARWDFDYKVGEPGEPNWDDPDNYNYDDGQLAITEVSYTYPQSKSYIVALQVQDQAGKDSNLAVLNIGPKIVITSNSINFGVIQPQKTKQGSVLVCNLGELNLIVNNLVFANKNPVGDYFSLIDTPTSFTLKPDPAMPAACNVNVDDQARRLITIEFAPQGALGVFTADLNIENTDELKTINLTGVSQKSPVGESAAENVIYDARIIANPPPGFVEFLEKLQFSGKEKPR